MFLQPESFCGGSTLGTGVSISNLKQSGHVPVVMHALINSVIGSHNNCENF